METTPPTVNVVERSDAGNLDLKHYKKEIETASGSEVV